MVEMGSAFEKPMDSSLKDDDFIIMTESEDLTKKELVDSQFGSFILLGQSNDPQMLFKKAEEVVIKRAKDIKIFENYL